MKPVMMFLSIALVIVGFYMVFVYLFAGANTPTGLFGLAAFGIGAFGIVGQVRGWL